MPKTKPETIEPVATTAPEIAAPETATVDASEPASDEQTANDAPTVADAPAKPAKPRGGKKKAKAKATADDATKPSTAKPKPKAAAADAAPKPPFAPKPKKRAARETPTLEDLGVAFFAALEKEGKSDATLSSYKMDYALALRELGPKTRIGSLTAGKVQAYFDSATVTRTRTGVAKAKPTVDKTRRVLRLALCWAVEEGLIEKAPLPGAKG